MKNVLKEKKNAKLEAIKSYLKKKQENQGKVLPNFSKEREYERNLKMIAVEGSRIVWLVTKLFQTIQEAQKNRVDTISEEISAKLKEGFFPKKNKDKQKKKHQQKKKGFLESKF